MQALGMVLSNVLRKSQKFHKTGWNTPEQPSVKVFQLSAAVILFEHLENIMNTMNVPRHKNVPQKMKHP